MDLQNIKEFIKFDGYDVRWEMMTMSEKTVLVADDEERIVSLVCDFLHAAGFRTVKAFDGAEAWQRLQSEQIDLAVIDIMMPELNGWELTRKIRESMNIPIVMLSARSEEFDMLEGFSAGADEYVTKPFSPAVLVKRIEALLRRSQSQNMRPVQAGLHIDKAAFTATLDGGALELTLKEFELLCALYDNAGQVLSRDQLLNRVWGYDYMGDNRTVDSHIARLRTKLGDFGASRLKTVYGMGYKLEL